MKLRAVPIRRTGHKDVIVQVDKELLLYMLKCMNATEVTEDAFPDSGFMKASFRHAIQIDQGDKVRSRLIATPNSIQCLFYHLGRYYRTTQLDLTEVLRMLDDDDLHDSA